MTSVSVQPRDVIFTFTDSCNCCVTCWCCKSPEDSDQLYVNSNGDIESFNKNKAKKDIALSFQRAKQHLDETLHRRVVAFQGDPEAFQHRISSILESIDSLGHINKAHIDGINELMLEYLKSKTGEK